ncbi:mitochondrial chaperone BCS1 [Beauveria bassiana ARSEF 2860]|uniref:Mitochondrial chaperone BCS1 n=1 Tax=Beauveria bassiana (strain ARSEF 2860) TaxID=655819 RepID=J5JE61_BEAB2|nr:mitochondrial chaperone BCS1 [Beauveria bassiana ARSEF 2860]EJP62026.1 mitochondrial chaperone BCS1 [Beauveria bassiana ARSEF 2860]
MSSNVFGTLYSQVSFLDTFFPGLGVALGYIHPLASGNSHLGAQLLCTLGLVVFIVKYTYRRVKETLEDHFRMTHTTYSSTGYNRNHSLGGRDPLSSRPRRLKKLEKENIKLSAVEYPQTVEDSSWRGERLSLTGFGTSSRMLQDFIDDCRTAYEKKEKGKTAVYVNGDGWTLATRRGQRHMVTVVLPEAVKTDFLGDVAEYLNPEARAWYADRGLPYHRGYLLHGKPGTGKSSLSFAAAGQFNLDIYVLNLAKDIDAIEAAKSRVGDVTGSTTDSTGDSVTLSGLLNALDGVASEEGRLLVMTTNHVDHIGAAIIRPGRVDKMIEFGLASRQTLLGLFRFIYMPLSSNTERERDTDEGVVKSQDAQDIQELAVRFADRVPEMKYSPAKVLSFLIAHKHSPRDAVENVIPWIGNGGEGFVPLRRQTSTMHTKIEEMFDVSASVSASAGMEDMQWFTILE